MNKILLACVAILLCTPACASHLGPGETLPSTCTGVVDYDGEGGYRLVRQIDADGNARKDEKGNYPSMGSELCEPPALIAHKPFTRAERAKDKDHILKYVLGHRVIRVLLSICKIGEVCEISGKITNMSHGVYVWTKIDSIVKH